MSNKDLTKEKYKEISDDLNKLTEQESFELDRKIIKEASEEKNCCRIMEVYKWLIWRIENGEGFWFDDEVRGSEKKTDIYIFGADGLLMDLLAEFQGEIMKCKECGKQVEDRLPDMWRDWMNDEIREQITNQLKNKNPK